MTNYYSLEFLIKTFGEHDLVSKENKKDLIERFKENNPNEPIPNYMLDDFNLPTALLSICTELLALKLKINTDEHFDGD